MSAALRLVDDLDTRPTFRPSMRPTLVPSLPPTLLPHALGAFSLPRISEAPTTQRSATVHPRAETAARQEAQNLLAVMRMNADFLSALLAVNASAAAIEALQELQHGIERLEQRFASSPLR
ncbi:hypothetical protein BH11MYX4_BH11MYX4_11470 [soil metagenome]